MNVEIKKMKARRLAMVKHRGDPKNVAKSVEIARNWAKEKKLGPPQAGKVFAFGYDDPHKTDPQKFRYDLGREIDDNVTITGKNIIEKHLPAGRYAIAMHTGSRNNLSETIYPMYREWLPESGEELADHPCIFCFHNFEHEVAETELRTECWLLLK